MDSTFLSCLKSHHNHVLYQVNYLIKGWVMIYASINQAIIGSDNGISPVKYQAIVWTNADILSIVPLETNFSKILTKFEHCQWRKYIWKYHL